MHRNRAVSVNERLQVYLKIAALLLEDGDSVQAETYVNRASGIIADTKEPLLIMQHKVRSHHNMYCPCADDASCLAPIVRTYGPASSTDAWQS